MIAESFAILAVCFLLLVAFMRSRFRKSVVSVLPIAILPALHLVAKSIVAIFKGNVLGLRAPILIGFFDAIAIGITCAVIVALGYKIKNKFNRYIYCGVMIGYSVLIGWAYIFNTLSPLL